MRTTSLLNVGPSVTCGAGGCSTARWRAATNAKTKADARTMRRMCVTEHHTPRAIPVLFACLDDSAVVRDLSIDNRQDAFRRRKLIGRNPEDVLRQHRKIREFAGGDGSFFTFGEFRERAAARVRIHRLFARDRLGRV